MNLIRSLKPRLLLFYGGSLVFVIALFHVVSRYGETRQAAPNIDGQYLSTTAMPGCPEASRVVVSIFQSGIYLNGAIALQSSEIQEPQKASQSLPPLSGQWQNQQVRLEGRTLPLCATRQTAQPIVIEGQVAASSTTSPATLTGVISGAGQPWTFTGQRLAVAKKEEGH
jgi:hypothetical protein